METPGQWLEKALLELSTKIKTGLNLDADVISGLVSYCEMAAPLDAKEFLDNIVGQDAGKDVIQAYLKLRTDVNSSSTPANTFQAYVKPRDDPMIGGPKKQQKKTLKGSSEKKESEKVVPLSEEASKGSDKTVFKQGNPCSCEARQHGLISNCLTCGKIVCEQEGEGPCHFCGALVLKQGSSYAGLNEDDIVKTDQSAAEAYAKRLVDYDRNFAARTTVIDDQTDYYEIEGNTWISREEKELLQKKLAEINLVGIKPNPTLEIQPVFVDPSGSRKTPKKNPNGKRVAKAGLCLEVTGRVLHD